MKKAAIILLNLFLLLVSSSPTWAARQFVNPVPNEITGLAEKSPGPVLDKDTSVTLLFTNLGDTTGTQLTPGWCYTLAKGDFNQFHLTSKETGHDEGEFWVQTNPATSGWGDRDWAKQAGGNLCGFNTSNDSIKGSGSDTPADYIRADDNGNVWFYNLCENMEGVRTDCNKKFILGATYRHSLFHVICKGKDDDGRDIPDESCNPSIAEKDNKGIPSLRIWGPDAKEAFDKKGQSYKMMALDGFKPINTTADTSWFFEVVSNPSGKASDEITSKTVSTEFGKLPRDPVELATVILRIALGVAGGVAFLLMVFGSFRLIFAAGSPDAVQAGREIITAAIIGLLVVIFATFILQLVGISILGLNV